MILAADPSSACVGLARHAFAPTAARPGPGSRFAAVACLADDVAFRRTTVERLWPTLDRLAGDDLRELVIERPPDHWKDDGTGRAKLQARVGFAIGAIVGLLTAWGHMRGVPVRWVPNGEWRRWAVEQMRRVDATRSPSAPRVTARRPEVLDGGGWQIAFDGCDHTWTASTFAELSRRPERCPTCERRVVDPLEHKRPFVELARALHPDFDAWVITQRGRSRRDDHAIPGVADVADAALLLDYVSRT